MADILVLKLNALFDFYDNWCGALAELVYGWHRAASEHVNSSELGKPTNDILVCFGICDSNVD